MVQYTIVCDVALYDIPLYRTAVQRLVKAEVAVANAALLSETSKLRDMGVSENRGP